MEALNFQFASFGQRLLARFIDGILVAIASTFLAYLIGKDPGSIDTFARGGGPWLFFWLYQPILEASGGTIGKRLVGIRPINLSTGTTPSLSNCYGRSLFSFLLLILLVLPAFIGCLAVLWNRNKQAWHDSVSNIGVIKDKDVPPWWLR